MVVGRNNIQQRFHPGAQEGLNLGDFLDGDPLQALHKNEKALAGQLDDLVYKGHRSNLKEIDGLGTIHARIPL
jgi:hypothetical protein